MLNVRWQIVQRKTFIRDTNNSACTLCAPIVFVAVVVVGNKIKMNGDVEGDDDEQKLLLIEA